jgi:flagellar hook-associated protein 2
MTSENKAKTYAGVKESITNLQEEIDKLNDENTDGKNDASIEAKQKQIEEYNDTLSTYDEINGKYGITVSGDKADEATFTDTGNALSEDELALYTKGIQDQIDSNTTEITAHNDSITANNKIVENTLSTDEIKAAGFEVYGQAGTSTIRADYADDDTYKSYLAKYEDIRQTAQDVMAKVDASKDADGKINTDKLGAALGTSDAVRIKGEDSEIVLNGATFTSNTNNYSINGLTITATAVTQPDEQVTITTDTDVDGIYNMIKDVLTEYNSLIKEMDTLYNADSSKGYDPLTDDEKDAMSDTEVEKWETKIKDSLLRRDSTLSGVISSMKNAMSSSYTINGKSYSLSSFGIATLGYFSSGENEKGVYHIDGDSTDSSTSGNTDKLRAAIASDPDTVVSFFTQLTQGLYDNLTKKMASSTVSSAYTIYNDKQMKKNYEAYDDTIEEWEDKISDMEDKYYDQFTAMETALAKLQSSTSSLSSLLGS